MKTMKRMESTTMQAEAAPENPCRPRVRDRIFDTACDLFYRQGIRAVGVDAIACEAGTNKMSFYRAFPSKDDLVVDYVHEHERRFWQWWDGVVAPHAGDPKRQALTLFEAYIDKPCGSTERGCAMVNAAVELREEGHPAFDLIRAHKAEIRRRFRKLAREMKARDPAMLGDALTLLLGGSLQSRLIFPGRTGPVVNAARAARILIEAHLD